MGKRAAIYVRVSSEEQRDGHSLDEQQRLCREFCGRREYTIAAEYLEVESAKNVTDRAQFQAMIDDAEAGRFDVIVCHKLDRFSRDVIDGLLTLKDLTRYGVAFVSASEDFDFTTPIGEVVLTLLLAFARWYRRNLIGETTKGKQGRARKGLSNATTPPFGYFRDAEGRDVLSDDADAAREAWERYGTDEYTDQDIAEWLNAQGKHTTGNWGKRPFTKDTVREMLQNPFYAGFVVYRGLVDRENDRRERMRRGKRDLTLIPGKHEALITQELFVKCQVIRKARGRKYGGRRPAAGRVYLLAGIAKCSHCGGPLRATRWGNANGYRCTARDRAAECNANKRMMPEAALLRDLDDLMAGLQLPDDIKAQAIELLMADDPAAAIRRMRQRIEAEQRRLNRMYQAGTVTDAYFDTEAARIRSELAGLELPAQSFDARVGIEAIDNMARLWQNATPQEQADIVQSIFERVDVDLDTRHIVGIAPKNEYAAFFRSGIFHSRERRASRHRET